jgi:hypothetical protein
MPVADACIGPRLFTRAWLLIAVVVEVELLMPASRAVVDKVPPLNVSLLAGTA